MRNVFIKELIEQARQDPNLYVLTGDLGFRAFEPFQEEFPDRFINVGVAEANMINVACGLALTSKRVCVYSIVPFITMRCLEQIRNNICFHNLNINIVGVGGGFSYGNQGISHISLEDLAIMRSLPNMAVLCPGDKKEAELVVKAMFSHPGPAFIRLGKAGEKQIYNQEIDFKLGDGLIVKDGSDITLISTGNIIENVLEISKELEANNISVRVLSFPCIKPINEEQIKKIAKESKAIFTVEEHGKIGGLGGAVAEIISEITSNRPLFKRFGLEDKFPDKIGNQNYLRQQNGLAVDKIVDTILNILK